ncbi:MAG TPA: DUF2958 domain-containing protein [Actinomycetota bacterium]|nr:DUF2958 domain-containing protein [Actinomycetota bacterium]
MWASDGIGPGRHRPRLGLCDLGLGFPEFDYVSLSEIAALGESWDSLDDLSTLSRRFESASEHRS